jgi:3-phenylpropionate/trans-cinnamate dioxygenase ferredoxin reductase component
MTEPMVMIGAGLAAVTAAQTLRDEGYDGPIRLIGREPHQPYLRPPLSKGLLLGTEDEESIRLRAAEWYASNDVELLLGVPVVGIDRHARTLEVRGSAPVGYGRLLIATGASPRVLPVPGADLDGVLLLRTLDDTRRLQAALVADAGAEPRRLVVVGSGWIGMEIAAAARTLGAEVDVIGLEQVPLSAAIGPDIGGVFLRRQQRAGVRFHLGETVTAIIGDEGRASGVVLGSGQRLPADLVLVAVGVRPDDDLARQAGLTVDNGIRVGDGLRTNDPAIWAAGDVAAVYRPDLGRAERLEHWANAIATGKVAGRSMLHLPARLDELPYFYTDQFDLGMEYWGHPSLTTGAELVIRGDLAAESFVAFWVRPDDSGVVRVVAGMHVNVWDAQHEITALISSGTAVTAKQLAAPQGKAA